MCYVVSGSNKGKEFIINQHSNNILAAKGGARGLDTRREEDEFDSELLNEYIEEIKEAGLTYRVIDSEQLREEGC